MDIKKLKPSGRYKSGKYQLINPEKYVGDPLSIIYRSSYEYKFARYCDLNENILKWSSEPIIVPYYSQLDSKMHKYFVDYWIKVQTGDKVQEYLIEVKPSAQLLKPIMKGNATLKKIKYYNESLKTFIVNKAKFEAAQKFAEQRQWKFMVLTENFLF